eukprot:gene34624-46470_t
MIDDPPRQHSRLAPIDRPLDAQAAFPLAPLSSRSGASLSQFNLGIQHTDPLGDNRGRPAGACAPRGPAAGRSAKRHAPSCLSQLARDCKQSLAASTAILTPDGPRSAGELVPGDRVLGPGATLRRVQWVQTVAIPAGEGICLSADSLGPGLPTA